MKGAARCECMAQLSGVPLTLCVDLLIFSKLGERSPATATLWFETPPTRTPARHGSHSYHTRTHTHMHRPHHAQPTRATTPLQRTHPLSRALKFEMGVHGKRNPVDEYAVIGLREIERTRFGPWQKSGIDQLLSTHGRTPGRRYWLYVGIGWDGVV